MIAARVRRRCVASRARRSSSCARSAAGRRSPNVAEVLGHARQLGLPAGDVDGEQRRERASARARGPRRGSAPGAGSEADRRLDGLRPCPRSARRSRRARGCSRRSPATGSGRRASLRNQLTWKMRGSLAASRGGADRAASGRSSRPCGSRRTAASRTGRGAARRRRRPRRPSSRRPSSRRRRRRAPSERASYTSGTVRGAAAAEEDRRDRHAGGILPLGRDRRALRGRHGEARVRVRGRARRSRASRARRASRSALRRRLARHALPPDVALGRQRRVGEDGVAPERAPSRSGSWR